MASIFTQIIQRNIPSHIIAENGTCISFLDIHPLTHGHALVVPKQEIDYIFNYTNEILSELMIFSKKIALAIKKSVPCKRIGMAVIGFEVAHAHIHLVPMNTMDDINFSNPKLVISEEKLALLAQKIKNTYTIQTTNTR